MSLRCPTCKHQVLPRAENPSFPFCSKRCKDVDLGKWLGEEFKIADSSAAEDEDGTATDGGLDPDEGS